MVVTILHAKFRVSHDSLHECTVIAVMCSLTPNEGGAQHKGLECLVQQKHKANCTTTFTNCHNHTMFGQPKPSKEQGYRELKGKIMSGGVYLLILRVLPFVFHWADQAWFYFRYVVPAKRLSCKLFSIFKSVISLILYLQLPKPSTSCTILTL